MTPFLFFYIILLFNTATTNSDSLNDNNNSTQHLHQPATLTPSLLNLSSNVLNPQAPVFVPNFYKQDFNSNNPPKSYADVVNANRDPLDNPPSPPQLREHEKTDSTTL